MKVTKEIIEELFQHTTYKHNGLDLDVIFENGYQAKEMQFEGYQKFTSWGDRYNLVYEILRYMNFYYPDLGFGQIYLHSDGGMQDYMITYKKGDYVVILSRETNMGSKTDFKSVNDFVEWLNNHVEQINTQFNNQIKTAMNRCCILDAGDGC